MEEKESTFPPIKSIIAAISDAIDLGLVPPTREGVRTALTILTAPIDKRDQLITEASEKSLKDN